MALKQKCFGAGSQKVVDIVGTAGFLEGAAESFLNASPSEHLGIERPSGKR